MATAETIQHRWARYAQSLNGIDLVALTKLDVLDTQAELRICTGYRYKGSVMTEFPADLAALEHCEPVYETMAGWQAPTVGVLEFEGLPAAARDYVHRIEDDIESKTALISTDPRREETIVCEDPLLEELLSQHLGQVLNQRDQAEATLAKARAALASDATALGELDALSAKIKADPAVKAP